MRAALVSYVVCSGRVIPPKTSSRRALFCSLRSRVNSAWSVSRCMCAYSIRCDPSSVTMRLATRQARAKFAPLARPSAASRATDRLYLFARWLLGLHRFLPFPLLNMSHPAQERVFNFDQNSHNLRSQLLPLASFVLRKLNVFLTLEFYRLRYILSDVATGGVRANDS